MLYSLQTIAAVASSLARLSAKFFFHCTGEVLVYFLSSDSFAIGGRERGEGPEASGRGSSLIRVIRGGDAHQALFQR